MKRVTTSLGLLSSLMCGLLVGSCASKPNGDVLAVQDIVAPQAAPACLVDSASILYRSRGTRDLLVPLTSRGYVAPLRLRNMTSAANVAIETRFGPYNDMLVNNTNVVMDGANLCYELDRPNDSVPKDAAASCDSLKGAQKAFAAGTANIAPGLLGVMSIDLFPPDVIPALGIDVAVGERKTVYVHVQGTGRLADGSTVRSNELVFPVEFCKGCLLSACGENIADYDFTTVCTLGQDDAPRCVAGATPVAEDPPSP